MKIPEGLNYGTLAALVVKYHTIIIHRQHEAVRQKKIKQQETNMQYDGFEQERNGSSALEAIIYLCL
jgi:hypothetical protein